MVLGAMIRSKDALAVGLEKLEVDDFYSKTNGKIFKKMGELFLDNTPVDITTLASAMGTGLESCGGRLYLISLVENLATTHNVAYHCVIVRDKSTRRKLIGIGREIERNAKDTGKETTDTIAEGESRLLDCAGVASGGIYQVGEVSFFGRFDQPHSETVATGIESLDRATGGLNKGDPIIIAARPSVGKTSLALQVARFVCKELKRVVIYTYETMKPTLIDRLVVQELGIDRWQWTTRRLLAPDMERFARAINAPDDYEPLGGALWRIEQNLRIDDTRPTPRKFALSLKLLKNRFAFDLVIIDYIQEMAASEKNEDVAAAIRAASFSAKDHNVPILILSQLHRQRDERYDPRPKISDLRGSGALEQSARVVGLLWNKVAPLQQALDLTDSEQREVDKWRGKVRFILAKNSEGGLTEFDLGFEAKYGRFHSIDYAHKEQPI